MLMQHIGVGYFGYYRATAYAMKHSLMGSPQNSEKIVR